MTDFRDTLAETAHKVVEVMDDLMELEDTPERRLWEAMRYATVAGGKRVRPFMVVASARMFGVVAGADELEVASIDAAAIAEDDLFDRLLVEQCFDPCVHAPRLAGRSRPGIRCDQAEGRFDPSAAWAPRASRRR